MDGKLKIGSARVDITPAVGTELCGHFRSDLRSNGIHGELYAKVLVLDDDMNRAVIVACDLLGLTSSFVASTREGITRLTGIDGKDVMIACTHTHSGPGSMSLRVVGKGDESYQDQLGKRIAGAVYLAVHNMKEVSISLGIVKEELAASRRVKWPDGSIRFDWLDPNAVPEGIVDKELSVLTARDADGRSVADLINFPCHPVTMSGNAFNLISPDFPGVATALIERAKGDGSVALFLNGAYADTHPRKDLVPGYNYHSSVKGDELTKTLGTILGAAALRISEETVTVPQAPIRTLSKTITAPLEGVPSRDELVDRMPLDRQRLEGLKRTGDKDNESWWLAIKLGWHEYLLDVYGRGGKFGASEDLEIQVMGIGDVYLVGLPGEVFSHIGLEIKMRAHEIGLDKVLVIALANGNPGYIPAEDDYAIAPPGKRGYELEGSYMLYGRPLVGPGTATLMVEAAVDLLKALSAQS
jgi:neutral ceramidase